MLLLHDAQKADIRLPLYLYFYFFLEFTSMSFVSRITLFPALSALFGISDKTIVNNNFVPCQAEICGGVLFTIFAMHAVHFLQLTSSFSFKIFKLQIQHPYCITVFDIKFSQLINDTPLSKYLLKVLDRVIIIKVN